MARGRPGQGRYARWERERRYLLAAVPNGVSEGRLITDRYLDGTRLRVRHVVDEAGQQHWKLGQKVRPVPSDPSSLRHTTIYLDGAEHDLLRALPGRDVEKRRWRWVAAGPTFAVDELLGRHAGLVLAETEVADAAAPVEAPPGTVLDVTTDDRFSGGALACATIEELAALLALVGTPGSAGRRT